MNTKIEFLYRDSSNYKTFNTVIVPGMIDGAMADRIMASLDGGDGFVPERLGLRPDRWIEYNDQLDHIYCQLFRDGISPTEAAPTVDIPADELVRRFEAMAGRWEESDPLPFHFCKPVNDIEI